MCIAPDIPEPTKYQASKTPVYPTMKRDAARRRGRRSTILTGGEGLVESSDKKTLLGA